MPFSLFNNALGTTTFSQAQSTAATAANSTAAQVSDTNAAAAPANASAAQKVNNTFTGLCEALNTHQKNLVAKGVYEIADVYEIEFAPASLGQSKMKKPGNTDMANTPNQKQDANGQYLNSATNSINTTGRVEPVIAGTQIIQFIDKVMRNSTYVSDQQKYIKDEVTGNIVPSTNSTNGQFAWYKVSVKATPLPGFDNKRRDHAYRMKFTVSPYAINQIQSSWFPKGRYRGSHKVYNYWFTGQNNAVLDFQQEYNNLFRTVLSGENLPILADSTSDPRNITRRTFMPASAQSSQGANKGANEAAANAADSLYSPGDQSSVKIRVVGDPAWMQQGEITTGVSASTFNFSPFNADGSINYDSQEVVFSINWNRPVDYNLSTGLADVNANAVTTGQVAATGNSTAQESGVYVAVKVRSTFSKGKFEQEIEGKLLVEQYKDLTAATTPAPASPSQATQTAALPNTTTPGGDDTSRQATRSTSPDGVVPTANNPTANGQNQSTPVSDSQPLLAAASTPTTSDGLTVGYANNTAPPTAGSLTMQQQLQNVANAEAGRTIAQQAPNTYQQQLIDAFAKAGVNNTPQVLNRET